MEQENNQKNYEIIINCQRENSLNLKGMQQLSLTSIGKIFLKEEDCEAALLFGQVVGEPNLYIFGVDMEEDEFALYIFDKANSICHNLTISNDLGILYAKYRFHIRKVDEPSDIVLPEVDEITTFLKVENICRTNVNKNAELFQNLLDISTSNEDEITFETYFLTVMNSADLTNKLFEDFFNNYKDLHAYAIFKFSYENPELTRQIVSNKKLVKRLALLKTIKNENKSFVKQTKFLDFIYDLPAEDVFEAYDELAAHKEQTNIFEDFKQPLIKDAVDDLLEFSKDC